MQEAEEKKHSDSLNRISICVQAVKDITNSLPKENHQNVEPNRPSKGNTKTEQQKGTREDYTL